MNKDFFEIKGIKQLCKQLDIPISEASKIEMRRNLVIAIQKIIQKTNWTHFEAATKAKVGRTVITAVLNGNLDKISTDRLIDIAQRIGLKVHLNVA